ncbi:MAG: GNAT family N-acetyltransferase [Micropepsaceae bacterium]
MKAYGIERGTRAQSAQLQRIELAAGTRFRDVGMSDIADHEPTAASILEEHAAHGRLYVALAADQTVAGFLIWSPKDGMAYIEEVSVHPDHAGNRLAARLLDRLASDVRGRHAALSLATFRDIAWNAPYYASLGFVELPRGQVGPQHEESWQHQAEDGLDMSRRIFMIRPVAAT